MRPEDIWRTRTGEASIRLDAGTMYIAVRDMEIELESPDMVSLVDWFTDGYDGGNKAE